LYVKGITIDNHIIIPYQKNSVYEITEPDVNRRIFNDYSSSAQLARRRLISLGLDSSLVVAITGKKVKLNRTLSGALAFREWLRTSNIDVTGINIISVGSHSRRTWMTYTKVMKKSFNIGIISVPDDRASKSRKYEVMKKIREILGIVYYWFILIPY
jgi:hypothetical protein